MNISGKSHAAEIDKARIVIASQYANRNVVGKIVSAVAHERLLLGATRSESNVTHGSARQTRFIQQYREFDLYDAWVAAENREQTRRENGSFLGAPGLTIRVVDNTPLRGESVKNLTIP